MHQLREATENDEMPTKTTTLAKTLVRARPCWAKIRFLYSHQTPSARKVLLSLPIQPPSKSFLFWHLAETRACARRVPLVTIDQPMGR